MIIKNDDKGTGLITKSPSGSTLIAQENRNVQPIQQEQQRPVLQDYKVTEKSFTDGKGNVISTHKTTVAHFRNGEQQLGALTQEVLAMQQNNMAMLSNAQIQLAEQQQESDKILNKKLDRVLEMVGASRENLDDDPVDANYEIVHDGKLPKESICADLLIDNEILLGHEDTYQPAQDKLRKKLTNGVTTAYALVDADNRVRKIEVIAYGIDTGHVDVEYALLKRYLLDLNYKFDREYKCVTRHYDKGTVYEKMLNEEKPKDG